MWHVKATLKITGFSVSLVSAVIALIIDNVIQIIANSGIIFMNNQTDSWGF